MENKDHRQETTENKARQQKTDPQITELKGYVDPNEKLEPEIVQDKKENKTKNAQQSPE